ncbi:MAG: His-Xaa-Ser system protein HxsD [Planctomycetota bacterium]|nr:His-Xaa-Ser system protein HxsD [Planctomycetota bacterium]
MAGDPRSNELVTCDQDGLVVEFCPSVYRLSAVKQAAYKFGNRFHVKIGLTAAGAIRVALQAKASMADPKREAGEFCNEVLDQELREQVAQETEGVRNLILAQAFSRVSLTDEDGDDADFHNDPLGIRGLRTDDQIPPAHSSPKG